MVRNHFGKAPASLLKQLIKAWKRSEVPFYASLALRLAIGAVAGRILWMVATCQFRGTAMDRGSWRKPAVTRAAEAPREAEEELLASDDSNSPDGKPAGLKHRKHVPT